MSRLTPNDGSDPFPSLAHVLAEFDARFPTEADCLEELYRRGCVEGVWACTHCGHHDLEKEYGARLTTCRSCHKRSWLTAGTFFDRIRLAKPWLAAIWLIERGMTLSSSRFSRVMGIAQSSAWHIFRKISTVIQRELQANIIEVPSAEFAFLFCKRSRETPARQHPRAEESATDERAHTTGSAQSSTGFVGDVTGRLNDHELAIYNCLSHEPLHVDSLGQLTGMPVSALSASLTMLELAGLVTRQFGDSYIRTSHEKVRGSDSGVKSNDGEILVTIMEFADFVHNCFHGISRKYLQNYIAAYYSLSARLLQEAGYLLVACLQFGLLRQRQIVSYVTPPAVKLPTSD